MPPKICPKCGNSNIPNAQSCNCGYNFEAAKMVSSNVPRKPEKTRDS